ncbi:MAG: hypothetical protein C0198_06765 [Sulfurihydrogenibium sp.]|nr:MAG: hypothetical protein C0198_06765 [Sulfurihydrogenibium sp.]
MLRKTFLALSPHLLENFYGNNYSKNRGNYKIYTKFCLKVNYFVENILKIKSFATKITKVETEEEYKVLKELGVDYLQGYFFGKTSATLLN